MSFSESICPPDIATSSTFSTFCAHCPHLPTELFDLILTYAWCSLPPEFHGYTIIQSGSSVRWRLYFCFRHVNHEWRRVIHDIHFRYVYIENFKDFQIYTRHITKHLETRGLALESAVASEYKRNIFSNCHLTIAHPRSEDSDSHYEQITALIPSCVAMEVRVETSLRESPEFSGRKTVNVCEFVSRYAGIKTLRMVSDPRSSMYFHPGSGKFADSLDTLVVCPLRVHTRAESGPAVWQVSEELSVWRLDEALEIGLREEKQDQRPLRIVVECTLDKIEGWEEAEKACKDHGVSLSKDMRLD